MHAKRPTASLRVAALAWVAWALPVQAATEGAPVEVAAAKIQSIARPVTLAGSVTAARAARLSVATGGLVTELAVDAGDRVERGDVLLELDAELAQWQWRSAQAAETQAREALVDAQRRLEEAERLAPQRSIAETVVRDLAAEVAQDRAALEQATAAAGYRRGLLERHTLRAPFDGVVAARLTDLGEWLNPGQAVLELVSTDNLRMDFRVPEDYLGLLDASTPVSFSLGTERATEHRGRVAAIVPVTDPVDRTFLLRITARDADAPLRPGMSARATLRLATGVEGLVVPRDAVLRFADGRVTVWTVEEGESGPVAVEKRVTAGPGFDGLVQIHSGLEAGERVVVRGNESLRDGQRVKLEGRAGV